MAFPGFPSMDINPPPLNGIWDLDAVNVQASEVAQPG